MNHNLKRNDTSQHKHDEANNTPILDVQQLSKSYSDKNIFSNLNWTVERGQFWGIIGPNGCGKSTLLRLLSGVEKLDEGQIRLEGQPIQSYTRKELAQRIAVLQQDGVPPLSYTVKAVIEMGRFPFQSWLGKEQNTQNSNVVEEILELLDLRELASTPLHLLSGGQRQRVALGKVMAQQPKLVLLDEPTTFLDLRYQMQFMELIARWQREQGLTVIAVMHDLNLAALFCEQLLLLSQNGIYAQGAPIDVLSSEVIASIFDVSSHVTIHPNYGLPQMILNRNND